MLLVESYLRKSPQQGDSVKMRFVFALYLSYRFLALNNV
jgi:hypothetical protein